MSLRRTLIAAFSILLTVVGGLASVYAYFNARSEAWGILDLQQRQIARFIGDGSGVAETAAHLPPHEDDEDFVVQVRFADGRPPITSDDRVVFPATTPAGFSEFTDSGQHWRLFTMTEGSRTVRVAQQTSEREELAADAAWNSSMPFVVAIPLSWLVVYFLAGAILRRLDVIAEQVARRGTGDVAPVDAAAAPAEVRPLLNAMNRSFAGLSGALEQQKRFVADAAHELRTPLAALTLQIGNIQSRNRDLELAQPIEALVKGVRRASNVTSQLLKLAREDSASAGSAGQAVVLDRLVLEALGTLVPFAEEKGVDLGLTACESVTVTGQEQELLTLCEILIDNAVRYTGAGGAVDVSVTHPSAGPTITVTDTGPGIPPESLERVFDRFYRINEADGLGTGLGLPIARIIATRQGAALSLENRRDRSGIVARIVFERSGTA